MTIGIIGSRRRNQEPDLRQIERALLKIYHPGDTLVSGGCPKGGDYFAEVLARRHKIPIKIHRPVWEDAEGNFRRWAGFERNTLIAQDADVLIACVAQDRTGGTEDTIRKFQKIHPDGPLYPI